MVSVLNLGSLTHGNGHGPWANHGQSAATADAGGEGHGPHRLEFTDGEGWNVMGFFDKFYRNIELQRFSSQRSQ